MWSLGTDAGLQDNLGLGRPYHIFPEGFDIQSDIDKAELKYPDLYSYEDLPEEGKQEISLEEFVLEDYEWHLAIMEERKQFEKLWPGFTKFHDLGPAVLLEDEDVFNGKGEPPDAGWGVLLSAILKKVEDKEERIRLLDCFFMGYLEYLSK